MRFLDFLFSLLTGIGTKQLEFDHPPVSPGNKKGSWIAVTLVAAGAIKVVSQLREGKAKSDAEKYNAEVALAEKNAIGESATFEDKVLIKQSELEQLKISNEKGRTLSTQKAVYAKSGVRLDEGSPLEVMADTAAQFEIDLRATRFNLETGKERIRFGSQTQQARLESEAEFRRSMAKAHRTASYLKAAGTIVSTGSSVAGGIGGSGGGSGGGYSGGTSGGSARV